MYLFVCLKSTYLLASAAASENHASSTTPEPQSARRRSSEESAKFSEKCSICLGAPQNLSYPDECQHRFCFVCLLEWSKVKLQCPLCKTPFKHIVHSIKAPDDFQKYAVFDFRFFSKNSRLFLTFNSYVSFQLTVNKGSF